ncbi:MAG TPA: hypothetical protein VLG41_18210 [Hydrogenophaga sp.]|uniref:hypothetical protein n=1 Tax=Hydrogenophaga sp. TaxID=1904254 RepID=UPI002CB02C7E|nr:hypothetical protein [Hydrogenophaga sp.]HSX94865.1 hypothetical protein [Hydrogenophaga sp.]
MERRNSIGNRLPGHSGVPTAVGNQDTYGKVPNNDKVLNEPTEDVLGTEPEAPVRLETDTVDREDVDGNVVEQAGKKLNGLTPIGSMPLALPSLPSLKDLPKGLVGAVGGFLTGGGIMGGTLSADSAADPGTTVLLTLFAAIVIGGGGFLIERGCRSDT